MALDTQARRLSAIGIGMPWRGPAVVPDGALGAGDRMALLRLFSSEEVVVVVPDQPAPAPDLVVTTAVVARSSVRADVPSGGRPPAQVVGRRSVSVRVEVG